MGKAQTELQSWGRYRHIAQIGVVQHWRDAILPPVYPRALLPYGQGRSYGDVAQNTDGVLVCTDKLDRFIAFDAARGILQAEAGARLGDILALTAPRGWYLPVVPGTRFVSVGGAIANDVHGKNHHRAGTFGRHVQRLELLRSDGTRMVCSPTENGDWFRATVGGLGLTGLITWAELVLRRIPGTNVDTQTLPCTSLGEFTSLCDESDATHEYTVAWFDCFSYRDGRFRGLFTRANHAPGTLPPARAVGSIPFTPPMGLVHRTAMRVFNLAYFKAGARRTGGVERVPIDRFLYPLDRINRWNRLYGPRGFLQLQCVIPRARARAGVSALLEAIAASGQGSFLAVLKRFGAQRSPGLLSFPIEGTTLALDFTCSGAPTFQLFGRLHAIVREHEGRIYPAKDACMSSADFEAGYPNWRQLVPFIDPGFGSDLWKRVTAGLAA